MLHQSAFGSVGGRDPSVLALRIHEGATMVAHGIRHGRPLDGTVAWFELIGLRRARARAAVAAIVGTMGVAGRDVRSGNSFAITDEGSDYIATLSIAAAKRAGAQRPQPDDSRSETTD